MSDKHFTLPPKDYLSITCTLYLHLSNIDHRCLNIYFQMMKLVVIHFGFSLGFHDKIVKNIHTHTKKIVYILKSIFLVHKCK